MIVRTDTADHIGGPRDGLLQILSDFHTGTVETEGAEPMTWAQKFYGMGPSKDGVLRVALSGTKILVGSSNAILSHPSLLTGKQEPMASRYSSKTCH